MPSKKLYLHLTGGLGNQMFQVVAGLSIAGNRELVIFSDLGKPRLNQKSQPEIFSFDIIEHLRIQSSRKKNNLFVSKVLGYLLRTGVSPKGIEHNKLYILTVQQIANVILSFFMRDRIRVFVSKGVGFESEINPKANLLIGYFQSYHWQQKVNTPEIFHIREFYETNKYKKYVTLAEKNIVLALHVRLGDYLQEDSFGIPSKLYYSTAISLIKSNFDITQIWVFTDSPDLLEGYLDISSDVEIVIIPNDSTSSAETLEVMRLAHHYVIANSSFSWWGARLSKVISPMVVAPNPWFKTMASPKGIVPPEWVTLDAWPVLEP
jgi:hypothetical protein